MYSPKDLLHGFQRFVGGGSFGVLVLLIMLCFLPLDNETIVKGTVFAFLMSGMVAAKSESDVRRLQELFRRNRRLSSHDTSSQFQIGFGLSRFVFALFAPPVFVVVSFFGCIVLSISVAVLSGGHTRISEVREILSMGAWLSGIATTSVWLALIVSVCASLFVQVVRNHCRREPRSVPF